MRGHIKLHRQFLEWEWYSDINVSRLFLHLLLRANHKPQKWQGIEIGVGELLTGRKVLSHETGLTEMQVRTSLNKLKSTNEITIKTTKQYSIISINNWSKWQQNNQQLNQRITNEQPTNNQQITTNKNDKNVKNDKKERDINISLSHIGEREKNLLLSYAKRKGKNDPLAYVKVLIKNNDYQDILIEEEKRLQRIEQKKREEQQQKQEVLKDNSDLDLTSCLNVVNLIRKRG